MHDLDLVETNELIDALLRRFDAAVLVGERPAEEPADGIVLKWCGRPAEARGWAAFAGDILTDEMRLALPESVDDSDAGPDTVSG